MFSGRIGALWELFLESFPKILLPGLATTIPLTAISFALALIIAVATALVQFANVKVLRRIARFYIWIFRGTPLLVQLYIVFYGLSRIGIVLAPFPAAVIVFALNEGAYCAETVRGFIDSLRTGAVQNAQPRFGYRASRKPPSSRMRTLAARRSREKNGSRSNPALGLSATSSRVQSIQIQNVPIPVPPARVCYSLWGPRGTMPMRGTGKHRTRRKCPAGRRPGFG